MTTPKRGLDNTQLVESCWHSGLPQGKRKVPLASIENYESYREGAGICNRVEKFL